MPVPDPLHRFSVHSVDLSRYAAHEADKVTTLLESLAADIRGMVAGTPDARRNTEKFRRLTQLGEQVQATLDQRMRQIGDVVLGDMSQMSKLDARWVSTWMQGWSGVGGVDPIPSMNRIDQIMGSLEVEGVAWSDWWDGQSKDTWRRFQREMRAGLIAGETMPELSKRVLDKGGIKQGIFGPTKKNADAIARTGMNQAVSDMRRDLYEENADVIGALEQVSTLDARTTQVCRSYDGKRWEYPEMEPIGHSLAYGAGTPRHWGCRSAEVPVVRLPNGKLMAPGGRASATGPTPGDFDYDKWLNSLDDEQIRDLVGPSQFAKYKSGKLPLAEAFRHQYRRPKKPPWEYAGYSDPAIAPEIAIGAMEDAISTLAMDLRAGDWVQYGDKAYQVGAWQGGGTWRVSLTDDVGTVVHEFTNPDMLFAKIKKPPKIKPPGVPLTQAEWEASVIGQIKKSETLNQWKYGLTPQSIREGYKGNEVFAGLVEDWEDLLEDAPKHRGTVHRGMGFDRGIPPELKAMTEVGAEWEHIGPASATTRTDFAANWVSASKHRVILEIESKGGAVDIRNIGPEEYLHQKEIVIRHGTKYRTIGVEIKEAQRRGEKVTNYYIKLEEI